MLSPTTLSSLVYNHPPIGCPNLVLEGVSCSASIFPRSHQSNPRPCSQQPKTRAPRLAASLRTLLPRALTVRVYRLSMRDTSWRSGVFRCWIVHMPPFHALSHYTHCRSPPPRYRPQVRPYRGFIPPVAFPRQDNVTERAETSWPQIARRKRFI